jgi:pyridoxal phosphate enzyme (YggS family)
MTPEEIKQAWNSILLRIQAAALRSPDRQKVGLLAVSKTQPVGAIRSLYQLGQRDFAENYAQELVEKAETLRAEGLNEIRWHFIGHLQTNKVKMILPYVHAIHSVDSLRLAQEISKRSDRKIVCFLEVNLSQEASKSGVSLADTDALVESMRLLPHTEIAGLMCIPSAELDEAELKKAFLRLREKKEELKLNSLSMGMSSDFEIAIEAGATHVRVGTALFGKRNYIPR